MAGAPAFNIEGAIRIRTAEAKASLVDLRSDLVNTTSAAKKAATETANAAKAPLAVLTPAPRDFSGSREAAAAGQAAAQSMGLFEVAVVGANRSLAAQAAEMLEAQRATAAHRAEIEAIRARYVPAAAAAQQYERQVREIAEAEKLGAITAREAGVARERAAASLDPIARKAKDVEAGANSAAGGIRGLGMQLNQVATVGGMTGDWMSAIAIQLPDILMAFGTVGIFAGVAAGALIPFASSLLDGADKAKLLKEGMEGLEASADAWRSALDRSMAPMDELRERFAGNAEVARELFDRLLALEQLDFADKLSKNSATLVDTFAQVRTSLDRIDAAAATTGANGSLAMEAVYIETSRLKDEFGLTVEEARGIAAAMDQLDAAKGPAQIVPAAQALYEAIAATAEAGGAIDPGLRDAARAALDTALQAAELAGKLGISVEKAREIAGVDMAGGIQAASEEARQLAAFLGMSLDRANAVANRGAAKPGLGFGLQATADPIYGGAKRLAFGDDPGDSRDGILDLTTPPPKKTGGGGGKSDAEKDADRAQRQAERDALRVADYAAGVQAEIDALRELDPVQQEIIRNREILDKADADQRAHIEGLIRERAAVESLRDTWDDAGASIYDALEGMAIQGETAGEVIESLTRSVAQLMLRAALLGQGPLASLFGGSSGGGLIGMGVSALMGAISPAASTGGTVTPFLELLGDGSFDKGGWTGGSDPSAVAGVVHAREYVFDAESTARIGVKNLDALRHGSRFGYRAGGQALMSGPAPSTGWIGNGAAPSTERGELIANFHISVQGTGNAEIIAATRAGIEQALDAYDRHILPVRIGQITADPRSIG